MSPAKSLVRTLLAVPLAVALVTSVRAADTSKPTPPTELTEAEVRAAAERLK